MTRLPRYFDPPLTPEERTVAKVEGWILGVVRKDAFDMFAAESTIQDNDRST